MTAIEKLLEKEGLLPVLQEASANAGMTVDELVAKCAAMTKYARPVLNLVTPARMEAAQRHDARLRRAVKVCRKKFPKDAQVFIATVEINSKVCLDTWSAVQEICKTGSQMGLPLLSCPEACEGSVADIFLLDSVLDMTEEFEKLCKVVLPLIASLVLSCADVAVVLASFRCTESECFTDHVMDWWRVLEHGRPTNLDKIGHLYDIAVKPAETTEMTPEQMALLKDYLNGKTTKYVEYSSTSMRKMRLS